METNVEQPSLGFEKLFKRAKSFYSSQSRNISSSKSRSKNEEKVVEEEEGEEGEGEQQQPSLQRQEESIDLSKPFQSKSFAANNSNKEKWRISKNLSKQDKSKYVNDILSPDAAMPEIRSGIASGSTNTKITEQNLSQVYRPESSNKNYNSYSNTISSNRLKEIINNSIIAAVENLTNETNSQIRKKESSQEENIIVDPTVLNQFSKSCKPCGKLPRCKIKSAPCSKPCRHVKADNRKMTGNVNIYICSEGNDAGSKDNNNNKKQRTESSCNSMSLSNATSCVCSSTDVCVCPSSSSSSSKTIRDLMDKRKKINDHVVTLKCICGKLATECDCLNDNLSKNVTETEEICVCSDVSSFNNQTTSNDLSCVNLVECDVRNSDSSPLQPCRDDFTTRITNSRSTSADERESYCDRENCDVFNNDKKTKLNNGNSGRGDAIIQECRCCDTSSDYSDVKSENRVCSCCSDLNDVEKRSVANNREIYNRQQSNVNYSPINNNNNTCNCCATDNESIIYTICRNKEIDRSVCCRNIEKEKIKNDVERSCNCCKIDTVNKELQDRYVLCKNKINNNEIVCRKSQMIGKSQVEVRRNQEYLTKPCESVVENDKRRTRYSNSCIMEEDEDELETCDASNCKSSFQKQQNSCKFNDFYNESQKFYAIDGSDEVVREETNTSNEGKNSSELIADGGLAASQTIAESKRMSVADVVKSFSINADKSTSSNLITTNVSSPLASLSKTKEIKSSRGSSLKSQFIKAKSFLSGKSYSGESKKDKISSATSEAKSNEASEEFDQSNFAKRSSSDGKNSDQNTKSGSKNAIIGNENSSSLTMDAATLETLVSLMEKDKKSLSESIKELGKSNSAKRSLSGGKNSDQNTKSGSKNAIIGNENSSSLTMDAATLETLVSLMEKDKKSLSETIKEFGKSNSAKRSLSGGKNSDENTNSGSKNAIIGNENSSSLTMDAATLETLVSLMEKDKKSLSESIKELGKSNSAKRSLSGGKNSDQNTKSGSKNAIIANENSSSLTMDAATLETLVSLMEKDKKSLSESIKELGKSNSAKRSLSGGKNSDQNPKSGSKNAIIGNENSSSLVIDASTEKEKKSLSESIKEFVRSNSAKRSLSGGKKSDKNSKSGSKNATIANENSSSFANAATGENSVSLSNTGTGGNSLVVIKSSVDSAGEKSKPSFMENSDKKKSSSSKLGSLIAERKNSSQSQSAVNDQTSARNYYDEKISCNDPCCCGSALNADVCNCKQENCVCNVEEKDKKIKEKSCKICKQSKRLCCCCCEMKNDLETDTGSNFRVCTLCCRAEKDCCCCNSKDEKSAIKRRSRSPSNSYRMKKSQICLYCEKPRENCACRAPVNKCSCCCMPMDVCNCQDVVVVPNCNNPCNYDDNRCQCNGRVVKNSENGDQQNICVTAWKPRREIRNYFTRNNTERDNPDCPCCETMKPYGSDELPYQRLSVFSDVMTELQQKMSELACCNGCGKIPCCCCNQESKNTMSKQRKSRSRSPPFNYTNSCKCGGRNVSSYQICDRCRTTPCRCRKSRSTQRKPAHAKCCYCKSSPCRCESRKTTTTNAKSCRCVVSSQRSRDVGDSVIPDKNSDKNSTIQQQRNCRCRCASPNFGSPSRV